MLPAVLVTAADAVALLALTVATGVVVPAPAFEVTEVERVETIAWH